MAAVLSSLFENRANMCQKCRTLVNCFYRTTSSISRKDSRFYINLRAVCSEKDMQLFQIYIDIFINFIKKL